MKIFNRIKAAIARAKVKRICSKRGHVSVERGGFRQIMSGLIGDGVDVTTHSVSQPFCGRCGVALES